MDKYKLLYTLTQGGWKMGKQSWPNSVLTMGRNIKIVILWDENKVVLHNGGSLNLHIPEVFKDYGFTEQKLPNENNSM